MKFSNPFKQSPQIKESVFVFEQSTEGNDISFKSSSTSQLDEKYKTNITKKLGDVHPFDFAEMALINDNFGVVSAITDKIIDFVIGPGIFIECEDAAGKKILNDWIEDTDLTTTLKPWLREAIVKGNGFMEVAGVNKENVGIRLKNINANTMYVKRNDKGKIKEYNQYLGNKSSIREDDIITFTPDEIMHYPLNKGADCSYGLGRIFPAKQIIMNFLSTQKSLHRLVKRKSSNPVHVKMGDIATKDYPKQADIDAFSKSLQFMDDRTEWVTGPNIDIKGVDFGNFGDKFDTVLDNDYQLLSTAFQVPEVLLGKGSIPEGLAEVQMDGFERMIKSLQDDIDTLLETKVLIQVLKKNKKDVKFNIKWGEQSFDNKLELITKLSEMIKNPLLSNVLRLELEKQMSGIMGLEIEKQLEDEAKMKEEMQKAEREREEAEPLPKVPGQDSRESVKGAYKELVVGNTCTHCNTNNIKESADITIKEWVDFNLDDLEENIVSVIARDEFKQLRAITQTEIAAGYLNKRDVEKLREVMSEGFSKNLSIKQIEKKLTEDVKIRDLYAHTKTSVDKEKIIIGKKARTNAIARTETVRLANIGALDSYKNKQVENVRVVAALSDRTCAICEAENGNIYPINEAYGIIPFHVNCRCTTSPVVAL